jgi:hypothetical protein
MNIDYTEIPGVTTNGEKRRSGKERWSDKCLYKCGSCANTYANSDSAGKHTKQLKHEPYIAVRTPLYACKVCGKSVLWSRIPIKLHVKTHKLTLEEYEKMHEETQENEKQQGLSVESYEETQENENQQENVEPQEKIQSKNVPKSENQIDDDVLRDENAWFDRCTLKCDECNATFGSTPSANTTKSKSTRVTQKSALSSTLAKCATPVFLGKRIPFEATCKSSTRD